MKMRIRVPYGVATSVRLGSLRDPTTGQVMTPTFAAGDAKITQDDGVGTDDADNIPTVDGTDVLWTISAAEATAPSANGPVRTLQLYDQGTKAWIDLDVIIETEGNSHLAAFPNGVVYGFTPTAAAAGTFTGTAAMQTGVNPLHCVAVVYASDEPLDIGASMTVDGWTAASQVATGSDGWTRTPTGTTSALRIALFANPNMAAMVAARIAAAAIPATVWTTSGRALSDPAGFKKNTAVTDLSWPMRDETGALVSGATVTGEIQKDGGAFAAMAGTIAEIGSTGVYQVTTSPAVTAGEMNADQVLLKFTASGCKPTIIGIFTET